VRRGMKRMLQVFPAGNLYICSQVELEENFFRKKDDVLANIHIEIKLFNDENKINRAVVIN
jgi:hypothetical protein